MAVTKWRVGTAASLVFSFLVASVAVGETPPVAPPLLCNTDLDCPKCELCVGATEMAKGACELQSSGDARCMCDADCRGAPGARFACALSQDKPLCGGQCAERPSIGELVCGAGNDVMVLEPLAVATSLTAPAARVVAGERLVIETTQVP